MRGFFLFTAHWWAKGIVCAALLALLALSRWPLAPRYLFYFDSVNFALALDEFNPAQHQPQPPGYPLYVLLTRFLHYFQPQVEQVFLLVGLLGAAAALFLLLSLGERMFSSGAGSIAALLLLFHPVFWLAGITNQVRIFLAAGGTAVALVAWRAWQVESPPKWFYLSALLLGLVAGFRPAMLVFLLPLVLGAGVHSRRKWREFALGGLLLALSALPWLSWTVARSGGAAQFYHLLMNYGKDHFQVSSILFGAPLSAAWRMAEAALVWNFLGTLSWAWAVPFAWRRAALVEWRSKGSFLALWFLPPFLFHAFLHVGDPDQTLITIPVVCLLGGWVLSQFRRPAVPADLARHRPLAWPLALAVALNLCLFFRPLPGLARACSYRVVEYADARTRSAFRTVRELRASGPIFLVWCPSFVPWRHFFYYFPNIPMLVLHGNLECPERPASIWLTRKRKSMAPEMSNSDVLLPSSGKVVWILPQRNPRIRAMLEHTVPLKENGPLVYFQARPGMRFQFAGHQFRTSSRATK